MQGLARFLYDALQRPHEEEKVMIAGIALVLSGLGQLTFSAETPHGREQLVE